MGRGLEGAAAGVRLPGDSQAGNRSHGVLLQEHRPAPRPPPPLPPTAPKLLSVRSPRCLRCAVSTASESNSDSRVLCPHRLIWTLNGEVICEVFEVFTEVLRLKSKPLLPWRWMQQVTCGKIWYTKEVMIAEHMSGNIWNYFANILARWEM